MLKAFILSHTAGIANTNATGTRHITHLNPGEWVLVICMSRVSSGDGTQEQGPSKGPSKQLSSCCIISIKGKHCQTLASSLELLKYCVG